MDLFNLGAELASFVGLIFTCYNVYQVWNIKRAIKRYSEDVDLSSVVNTMCETSDFIENIRTKKCLDKDAELQGSNVIKKVHETIGLVEGVNKMYFKEINEVNAQYYDIGYYNDIFLTI